MATWTATMADRGAQFEGHHVGVHAKTCEFSLSTALSAGDVGFIMKVGLGTRVLGLQVNAAGGAGNDFVAQFGYDGSLSAFGSITGIQGAVQLLKGCPAVMSRSDDAVPRWRYITMQTPTVTSTTNTGKISVTVWLTNDIDRQP